MTSNEERATYRRTLETVFHLAVVGLLVIYCFQVARPFIQPIVWGGILAIAIHPIYKRLRDRVGGRSGLSATLLVVAFLLVLMVPSILIGMSLAETTTELVGQVHEGTLQVPPPPSSVADWPIVGGRLHASWTAASQNLEEGLRQAGPAVKSVAGWLVATSASAGGAILLFAVAICIAGAFLANGESVTGFAYAFAQRLFGERGEELVNLSRDTVESVTRGILGVAVIQSVLSGVGMLVADVPAAGLWALLVLLMAVVQIPTVLLLGPIIFYVFATSSTLVAVPFAIWTLAVALSDNVLKPMLLGRGASVPMLVIFVGAIGGFMLEGLIGLFVGAAALSLGFTLMKVWLEDAI
jgi:predicted PurR-regulated permease PerM